MVKLSAINLVSSLDGPCKTLVLETKFCNISTKYSKIGWVTYVATANDHDNESEFGSDKLKYRKVIVVSLGIN